GYATFSEARARADKSRTREEANLPPIGDANIDKSTAILARRAHAFGGVLPGIPRRTSKRAPSPTRMRRASTASAIQPSITAPTAASLTSTGPHKRTEAHVK